MPSHGGLPPLSAPAPKKRERLLHGMMTFLILRSLIDGPSHGYALEGYLSLKLKRPIPPGTIYVILSSLNEDGLVSVKERTVINGRAVTIYELTQLGRQFLLDHKEPMLVMRDVVEELIRAIDEL
jgi:PadR family transcriptional regulator, regulatory protein PadR